MEVKTNKQMNDRAVLAVTEKNVTRTCMRMNW